MKNRLLQALLMLLFAGSVTAQCIPKELPFSDGEKITYIATYNWGPVWVDAGEVTFSVERTEYRNQPAWHFRSTGRTYPAYDFLFKVRDYYDSWADTGTLRSLEFRRQINEGGYIMFNNTVFFQKAGYALSNTKRPDKPITTDTLPAGPCLFDMLTSVYYVRSLDLDHMEENVELPVNVLIDDSVYVIKVKKTGKAVMANRDGINYPCIVLKAEMVEGTIFRKGEEAVVWITDDRNKLPIVVEAKILVGTVKAYLKEATGLQTPLPALK